MNSAKFKPFFGNTFRFPNVALSPRIPDRSEYELVVLCFAEVKDKIRSLVEQDLSYLPDGTVLSVETTDAGGVLARVSVRTLCTIKERAELAKIVTRLGLERSVRSTSWIGVLPRGRKEVNLR